MWDGFSWTSVVLVGERWLSNKLNDS
jgi:hypothetical protein